MCGINGLISLNNQVIKDGELLIKSMNKAIAHRGPDDTGVWQHPSEKILLGHQRLSIIDLTPSGHQPMSEEGGNTIVFNGEIYNYKDIKKANSEITFNTESDTEVLLKLYKRKGHNALKELNGMFAFAIWDETKQILQIAKDRAGKKPFYYIVSNGIFAFSSEIKGLLTLPWVKPELDEIALYHFLTFNQLSAPQTMFKNICKLDVGATIDVSTNGNIQIENYWDVEYSNHANKSEKIISEEVLELLNDSIKLRMVADVPVGAFLSGGVDSSAVVALMRNFSANSIKTYSVGFENQPNYDERIFADQVSKKYNTEHYEKIVRADEIRDYLEKIVEVFDEPMADSTAIPIYFISQLARENGTIVVQTGDGADEIFAGYRNWQKYFQWYPWYHRYNTLPTGIKLLTEKIFKANQSDSPINDLLHRATKNQEFFWGGAKSFRENNKREFLSNDWCKKNAKLDSYIVVENVLEKFKEHQKKHPELNELDWMCYYGFKEMVPWLYLYRMDRLGMANSIEIRNPFLDYRLVNLALSIPSHLKIKNGEPKYILKKALEPILSNDILYRKKKGFCVPLREWGEEIMVNYVDQHLTQFCKESGIFNEIGLRKFVNTYKSGLSTTTNQLWTIYFLMLWFKRWIN